MSSKLLPCVLFDDVLCSFRKSEKVKVMDRCSKCPHYARLMREMEREEDEFWGLRRRGSGFSVEAVIEGFSERYKRELARRVALNRAILTNKYWFLPVDDVGHEEFAPVGRGVKNSDWCGKSRGLLVCKNKEGHKGKLLNNVGCTDKVVVRPQHFWCKKSSCPVCFIRGWSVRGAKFIEGRLNVGVERGFGKIEHIVVSVSEVDRDLFEPVMRKKCHDALSVCGVVGGCLLFHGYRIDRARSVLVWSPHYHVLGFVLGGYDRCRHCTGGDCYACDGFEGRCYRVYRDNSYIVRVLDERRTVFGTGWYQLHHASIRVGIKRFHVVTWFGVCGYNNLKGKRVKVEVEVPCPACGGEMVRSVHVGKRRIVKDLGDVDYVSVFIDDEFDEFGKPNYVDVVGGRSE
jgi:hypothetical protein